MSQHTGSEPLAQRLRQGTWTALSSLLIATAGGCTGEIQGSQATDGYAVPGTTGATGDAAAGTGGASTVGSTGTSAVGSTGTTSTTATSTTGGMVDPVPVSMGGVKLRLLTRNEYLASIESLFGEMTTPLDLPEDTPVGGYISVGAAKVSVNPTAAEAYETASRAAVAEVFADPARWQALVGCQPEADLSGTCVESYVTNFGKRAFRRDLTPEESQKWVALAREAAGMIGDAAGGLETVTSGFLQSPNFLYRAETNAFDTTNGRLKYDGRSMAVRLAYFLTEGPPSTELLAAGESGQLETAEGVRAAAAPMLNGSALVDRLSSFFDEYTQLGLVMEVEKSPELFPDFSDDLRESMREGTRLFFKNVVLAPGADVRSFFDSDQFYADAALAEIYGVPPPDSGFARYTMGPESGRAGIMGQAGILAAHSKADHSSPTARGLFMLQAFLCTTPNPPPAGVVTELVVDPTLTTREKVALHSSMPVCASCHRMFDPMGLALEHFDSLGRYRETEDGLPIDATGTLEDGTAFDGGAELGTALGGSTAVNECLLRNFYRSANGRADDVEDQSQFDAMLASLSSRGYVLTDMVSDFVASDAFRSAPALPITGDE